MSDRPPGEEGGEHVSLGVRIQQVLLKVIARCFAALPLRACLAVGRFLGFIFGGVIRYHRKEAKEALERSLPEYSAVERKFILRAMYTNLGMNIAESLRLAGGNTDQVEKYIEVPNTAEVARVLEAGKGALILTAHFGNWDLLSVLTPRLGYPLTIISKDVKNRALNDFWMDMRKDYALSIVPAHNSYRACRNALKKNELVGFILDQNMIDKEGVFVDFFGKQACTTPGLAYMAAQAKAPVIPVFIHRRNLFQHEVIILPAIEPPPDREPDTIRAYTERYTKTIEEMVRQYPDQWIWLHRRWRTRPREEREERERGKSNEKTISLEAPKS